jgi:hypothetical protein
MLRWCPGSASRRASSSLSLQKELERLPLGDRRNAGGTAA